MKGQYARGCSQESMTPWKLWWLTQDGQEVMRDEADKVSGGQVIEDLEDIIK